MISDRKQIIYETLSQVPERVVSQGTMLWNKTGSWRYMRPVYRQMTPPCNNGCPAGNNIEGFIRLAEEQEYEKSLALIREENPLSGICGRVCFHPCETACNRGEFDQPVSINAIERFVFDRAGQTFTPEKIFPSTGKTVAVVGSGPAGLTCAYHLARFGHTVTIFEKADKPGGILRYGIPAYRLPKDILDLEIKAIESLDVVIRCRKEVGNKLSWQELTEEYDAVFIGTGRHKERELFDHAEKPKGCFPSLDYLTRTVHQEAKLNGKTTAVIGGGNSAIDAARTALRQGSRVTVYYHRTKNEMPAFEEEIQDAVKEGVKFEFLVQPVDLGVSWGKVKELKLRKTRLGQSDSSGRRRPEPIEGSDFTIRADNVITAIGEQVDWDLVPADIEHDRWKIWTDEFGKTGREGIWAGGDTALDEHNIAEAIGSGKAAACAIDAHFSGMDIHEIKDMIFIGNTQRVSASLYALVKQAKETPDVLKEVVGYDRINKAYFLRRERAKKEKADVRTRLKGFDEICKSLSENAALAEAGRCFHCGVCTQCDNCVKFCPDVSVIKRSDGSGYDIDLDYCKGCGICVNECPRSSMAMEEDV